MRICVNHLISLLALDNKPRSDEIVRNTKGMMNLYQYNKEVLDLDNIKTHQAQEITSLKLRVKKLEKKRGSRTHKLKRLYKVGRSARVISSDEASLGVLDDEEVFIGQDMAEKEINLAEKKSGIKGKNYLAQSIPDDHVADFHYMKMQEFSEVEGLHKGYDRMQKILSQLNQLKAKPEDKDINLKFLRALPSSWSQSRALVPLPIFPSTLEIGSQRFCRVFDNQDSRGWKEGGSSKAMITVDTLVDWTDHDGQSDGVIASKEFGMIAGCDIEDAIEEGAAKIYNLITGANTKEVSTAGDAREFSLMGVTSESLVALDLGFIRFSSEILVYGSCWIPQVTTTGEVVTTANVDISTANEVVTITDDLTLAQTLIEIKNKGKGIMVKPEKPMKKKELIRLDEEIASKTDLVEGSSKRAGEELEQENVKKQKVDDDKETANLKSLMEVMQDEEEVALDAIPLAVKSPSIVD
ncbi:hypothetical protein Tco_0214598 [Tanacetum coccineum]